MSNTLWQTVSGIAELIASERIAPGEVLPGEKELEELFHVRRHYVYYAQKILGGCGIVERRQRSGSRVLRPVWPFERTKFRNRSSRRVCLLNHLSLDRYDFAHLHYNPRFTGTLERKLAESGRSLECYDVGDIRDPEHYRERVRQICEGGVLALVLVSGGNDFELFARLLFTEHDNVFIFNRGRIFPEFPDFNQVGINNFAAGVTAAETAVASGCTRLLFCTLAANKKSEWLTARRQGASSGAWRLRPDHAFLDNYILGVHGDFPLKKSAPETGLIAVNDLVASFFIESGRRRGLEPGRDYKIIGFDDDSRFRELGITTLSPNLECVAATLADGIAATTAFDFCGQRFTVLVPPRLVRRRTM